ncbi:MAG: hypothetical protein HXX17_00090 [Geobacteraceae bacterium]|nr:hypothetical protein [Geobacteraceae bacterium]
MITIWPLLDYRVNSSNNTSKLSILGPILTFESSEDDTISAFRPFFHTEADAARTRNSSYYLYPLASSEVTPDVTRIEILQVLQKNTFRKAEPKETEKQSMLFPFYISGETEQQGAYTSIFPIYGDIYGRFWRDEYHYVLFPLYGRTVNKGTTNYHLLWPIFSLTSGENETGFDIWPLYGQSSKEGVYNKRFVLWPFFTKETRYINANQIEERSKLSLRKRSTTETGADSAAQRLVIFPLYASYDAPNAQSRTWLWPFFGYSSDTLNEEEERDYLWPFWLTVSGKKRNVTRFLPFYSDEQKEDSSRTWYMWPLYRNDTMQSPHYRQERDRILFFLFNNKVESWAQDGKERHRMSLWPLFLYNKDTDGERTLTFPALLEPVLDRDGIEKIWAPLWRVYSQSWNEQGDSSLSILWNLYWHERDDDYLGWELFPLLRYRSDTQFNEVQILKGLVKYRQSCKLSSLSLFWIPLPFDWQSSSLRCESEN